MPPVHPSARRIWTRVLDRLYRGPNPSARDTPAAVGQRPEVRPRCTAFVVQMEDSHDAGSLPARLSVAGSGRKKYQSRAADLETVPSRKQTRIGLACDTMAVRLGIMVRRRGRLGCEFMTVGCLLLLLYFQGFLGRWLGSGGNSRGYIELSVHVMIFFLYVYSGIL